MFNKNPQIKKFVKTSGPRHADSFEALSIKYIPGHNPDLVCYDDVGAVVERIDLTTYKTLESIQALVESKGFKPKAAAEADVPPKDEV